MGLRFEAVIEQFFKKVKIHDTVRFVLFFNLSQMYFRKNFEFKNNLKQYNIEMCIRDRYTEVKF